MVSIDGGVYLELMVWLLDSGGGAGSGQLSFGAPRAGRAGGYLTLPHQEENTW